MCQSIFERDCAVAARLFSPRRCEAEALKSAQELRDIIIW